VTPSDGFVELAWAVGAVTLALTAALALRVLFLRRGTARRERRREAVFARWRPILFEWLVGGDPALPPLAARDVDTFLLLWNQIQDGVRGDARDRLVALADRLGGRALALARLGRSDALGRMLALRTLGYVGSAADYEAVARDLDDRRVYLCLAAARALVFIDGRAAPGDLLPRMVLRTDWPVALFATVLAGASSAELAARFQALQPQLSAEQLVRLLPLVSILEPAPADAILGGLLHAGGDPDVIGAALKRARSPGLAPLARRLCGHEAWTVRTQAAAALGRIGGPADRDALVALLSDRQWWVRYRAAEALTNGRFGSAAEVRALAAGLDDRFARHRRARPRGGARVTPQQLVGGAQWFFLGYFLCLNLAYLALSLVSLKVIDRDADARATLLLPRSFSGLEPPVTVVVPAYNEAVTIAGAIRSMLQLEYSSFEIVVVNDGSTDGTLEVLRREFELVPFPEAYRVSIPTRTLRAVYRSVTHGNLRVVDKENGGKADALNAGINAARSPLFCAVDADSILQRDSLQRVVRPFLEDASTVACGGTVRIANGCRVSEGFMEEVGMPRSWLARVQIVEYLRAFLFGRMGWSPMNAMLIVSGAFGLFRRTAVIDAGGYRPDTVGEDMELVVRLHRQHRLAGKPYRIVFVPDPICWTEAPESLRVLRAQRARWQRGLLESLHANRGLLFHPRGGAPGWLAFPVLVVFEALGPLVEVAGYGLVLASLPFGWISGSAVAAFLLAAVGLGALLSASALLLEEMSFHLYERPRHLGALMLALVIENLGYRQLTALWRAGATIEWLVRVRRGWGDMKRTGWQARPPVP